jgi:hypothetical protein
MLHSASGRELGNPPYPPPPLPLPVLDKIQNIAVRREGVGRFTSLPLMQLQMKVYGSVGWGIITGWLMAQSDSGAHVVDQLFFKGKGEIQVAELKLLIRDAASGLLHAAVMFLYWNQKSDHAYECASQG